MTPALDAEDRVEVRKIARLLRVDEDALGFLSTVGDDDLVEFRGQLTDVLFDANIGTLKRLASAAKLMPSAVLAKIAEAVFGPLLCARIAGLIEPIKATEVAKRLSSSFLADVAVELDPRRAHAVIGTLPPKLITPVAAELARREDWITLGRFVGVLRDEPLVACITEQDESALLRIALVVEDAGAIGRVVDLLPRARREVLLVTAQQEQLWPAILNRVATIPEGTVSELAQLLAQQDSEVLDGLVAAVVDQRMWVQLLPFARVLPAGAQETVADVARTLSPEVRAEIVREAEGLGVFDDLGPIADALTARAA